jgi:hypothetical protein
MKIHEHICSLKLNYATSNIGVAKNAKATRIHLGSLAPVTIRDYFLSLKKPSVCNCGGASLLFIIMVAQRKGEEYLNWKVFPRRGLLLNDH